MRNRPKKSYGTEDVLLEIKSLIFVINIYDNYLFKNYVYKNIIIIMINIRIIFNF